MSFTADELLSEVKHELGSEDPYEVRAIVHNANTMVYFDIDSVTLVSDVVDAIERTELVIEISEAVDYNY